MSRSRASIQGAFLGSVLLILALTSAAADEDWDRLVRDARKLMTRESLVEDHAKRELLDRIAADDSARAGALLVDWALASRKFEAKLDKAFQREAKKARRALEKLDRRAKKAGGHDAKSKAKRRVLEAALRNVREARDAERAVDPWIADAVARLQDEAAQTWLFGDGARRLLDGGYSGQVLLSLVGAVPEEPDGPALAALIRIVGAGGAPEARIRALDRVGALQAEGALEAVVGALQAKTVTVRRAALRALWRLDTPSSVEPLVRAMKEAYGLLAVEIDDLLFHFIGVSMDGDGDAWRRWWKERGADWEASGRHERHERRPSPGDAAFYGIVSPSKRIVFVIDHSGSMQKPSGGLHATTGEPMGRPRIVEAKSELTRAIRALPDDVRFNVIFYSSEPAAWKEPRELALATQKNKAEAVAWIEAFEPETTTALFEALDAVFDYTDDFAGSTAYADPGVDTVFLLTDGIPTREGGGNLSVRDIDARLRGFGEANAVHRIVVHTVGVGRGHDRRLMQRIAKVTGGNYVSVATE